MPSKLSLRMPLGVRLASTVSAFVFGLSAAAHAQPSQIEGVEEIVVRGIALSQQRAIDTKREAEAILDAIAADDLGRLPDKNSAEALARLPGVNITQDQGEGRYVSIRGASPNLNSITLNGLAVGTVEENSRRVPLDILGGELLGGIEVVKAVTPDMEANAIGGYINVKTPSAFDYDGSFFGRGTVSVSSDEYSSHTPYAGNILTGGKFGTDESVGVILGVSYTDRHYLTKGLYVDDWRDVAGLNRGLPESHKFNDYDLDRDRLTLIGALEFKPDEDNFYYLRGTWTEAKESEIRYRNRNYFGRSLGGISINADGQSGTYTNQRHRLELRAEDKNRRIGNFSIGGENTIDNFEIEYAASLIDNRTSEPNQGWVFQANGPFLSGTFDMGPEVFEVRPNIGGIYGNLDEFELNSYSAQNLVDDDEGVQFKADVKYNLEGRDFTGYLKAGALYRTVKKSQDIGEDAYELGSGGAVAFNAGLPNLVSNMPLEGSVLGQFYEVGPRLSLDGLRTFTAANINNAAVLELNAGDTLEAATVSDFETEEDILAVYLMGSFTFGDWTLIGGGRLEQTDVSGESFDLVNGTTVQPVTAKGKYTDFMPAIHIQYRPEDVPLIVRAAWTNTIGRPEYSSITARRVIERTETDPGVFEGSISQGNPDLTAFESMNFDLSVEYYLDDGILSAAGFYKDIDNFIISEVITQNNVTFEGINYETLTTSTPRNAESGKIKGVELNYQQRWSFLPAPFDGFGTAASITLVDSSLRAPGRTDKLPFVGQANTVYSLTGFYQQGPFEAVLSYDWADNILVDVGGGPDGDFYDKSYGRVDLRTSYRISDSVSLFFDLLNINEAALGEFQGRETWVSRREVYGMTGTIGATVTW